jgi:hypothetical protein
MVLATFVATLDSTAGLEASAPALMGEPSEVVKVKEKTSSVSPTGVTEGVSETEPVRLGVVEAVTEGVSEPVGLPVIDGVTLGLSEVEGVTLIVGVAEAEVVVDGVLVCEGVTVADGVTDGVAVGATAKSAETSAAVSARP